MMTATVAHHRMPSIAGPLLDNGLVIHEFDQWDNPKELEVAFSGVCWTEFTPEYAE